MNYKYKIITGNCLDKLKELEDNSIDAIVTDPPYELGFMGKKWDNSGIAYNVELWKECLRVLKHGGHLLSFGGTRTYHRMTCAIEDAGFEIRDCVFWAYGSGFPKSLNIGKKAKEWGGWGTALKPAVEPIVMARKPLKEKTIVENVIKWGVGGINIDESRIAPIGMTKGGCKFKSAFFESGDSNFNKEFDESKGRFPANLIWTHHPNCKLVGIKEVSSNAHYPEMNVTGYGKNFGGKTEYIAEGERPKTEMVESWECVEGCPSKEFDKAGVSKSSGGRIGNAGSMLNMCGTTYKAGNPGLGDEGTPARFFKSFSYEKEDLDYAPFYYCAKASKSERNEGLDGTYILKTNVSEEKRLQIIKYLEAIQ